MKQALSIPLTEAEFQAQVVNLAESFGWQWMHIGRTGKHVANGAKGTLGRGWPDLTLVRSGRLIFAELKAQQAPPIPEHQRTVLNHLADAGAECHVWRPSDLPLILEVLR